MRKIAFLLVALALSSALTAQAAPANNANVISYLPFTITTAGTYTLKANLNYPNEAKGIPPAITVLGTALTGPVVLDLKGFTLSGPGGFLYNVTGISIPSTNSVYPITIQNGTVSLFDSGISVTDVNNLTIKNVVFSSNVSGLSLTRIAGALIKNCDFNGRAPDSTGIYAIGNDSGNNIYDTVTFVSIDHPIIFGETEDESAFTLNFKPTPVKTTTTVATNP